VCQACGLDCHALVLQLQATRRGSTNWEAKRWRILHDRTPPAWQDKRAKALAEKLVAVAQEGHAWHADHIVPVYEGGRLCGLDNLRTLCVVCHAAVTRQQAQARAAERRRRELKTQVGALCRVLRWVEGVANLMAMMVHVTPDLVRPTRHLASSRGHQGMGDDRLRTMLPCNAGAFAGMCGHLPSCGP